MTSNKHITVAALQSSFGDNMIANIDKTIVGVRDAAKKGAQVILPSELFQGEYFCTAQDPKWFDTAYPADQHPCVKALQPIARELGVVIPVSFFEQDGPNFYNSVAIVDHEGEIIGVYRKSHIPDGPGYQEKYYFRPGNTGFKAWDTKFGRIGVGICWDQWFPECARAMTLLGAEILFYPTAIGSEPYDESLDTSSIWQRAMQGHAVSNAIPVVAANRIGKENANGQPQSFYGHSFITDQSGAKVQELGTNDEGAILHTFDREELRNYRASWGFFRDRRSDLYDL
jgi:N-carbamoylputrescine amidase